MTRLDVEYRECKNGMIDYGHYRAEARSLRQQARTETFRKLWTLPRAAFRYFKLPQKRWMREQASSKSSVLVA